ncbi:MAG TPA: hypothetical protein PLQ97_07165 [Myxococcota bacterium]|nr:hypothetical protein [Myxococcota bacterium]HQK50414.1 hypothetical protein [Myxococcota bacterium]
MRTLDDALRGDPTYERITSGRWAEDCWLLQPDALKELGRDLSEAEVRASVGELMRLYPREVCARPLEDRTLPTVTVGLFFPGMYWHAWPPLYLGLDLTKCPGWESDKNLVGDLRRDLKYWQRRVEVGVWAGLNRKGLGVQRLEASGARTPDFLVNVSGQEIVVEVKTLGTSAEDDAAAEVSKAFTDPMYFGHGAGVGLTRGMGKRVFLRLNRDLAEGLAGTDAERDAARSQLLALIPMASERTLWALGGDNYPFDFDIPGLGHVRIEIGERADSFEPQIVNLPETPFKKQVERALRSLRSAAGQCRDGHPLVAVLHSFRYVLPAAPARELLARQMLRDPDRFRGIDAVLLHNHYRDYERGDRMVHAVVSWTPPWSTMKVLPRVLEQGVRAWTSRL